MDRMDMAILDFAIDLAKSNPNLYKERFGKQTIADLAIKSKECTIDDLALLGLSNNEAVDKYCDYHDCGHTVFGGRKTHYVDHRPKKVIAMLAKEKQMAKPKRRAVVLRKKNGEVCGYVAQKNGKVVRDLAHRYY